MNIFGIGPLEALFFIVIMLVILGPADMVKVGRTLGTNLRKLWTSPTWRMIFTASDTLRKLPTTLAREAGIEELRQELQRETETLRKMQQEISAAAQIDLPQPAAPPSPEPPPADFPGWTTPIPSPNSILPPHLATPRPSESDGESPGSDHSPSQPI